MKMAVTVDDLPGDRNLPAGMSGIAVSAAILRILTNNQMSRVYGFANGSMSGTNPEFVNTLKLWLDAGYPLGNHTYGHINLDDTSARDYLADIAKMQSLLDGIVTAPRLRSASHVFRYPYLAEGSTIAKRAAVRNYLLSDGYRIAEVTIDYNDWAWNQAYVRCRDRHDNDSLIWLEQNVGNYSRTAARSARRIAKRLFNRDIVQILLVHDTYFDSLTLDSILKAFRKEGVEFVSLDEALEDPVYKIDPHYVYSGGATFLAQIAASRDVDVDFDDAKMVQRLEKMCQ
jgi:peptidoglycan/xylan/chitin deacetylase (PgdA/CDA1 family)